MNAKKLWVELKDVVVGDMVIIYREFVTINRVKFAKGKVNLTGRNEIGVQIVYIGVADESVQKVSDEDV